MTSTFAVLLFLAAAPAQSQQATEAREHAEKAKKFYDQGDWAQALAEYELSYASRHEPDLLFNMAQCYRQTGQAKAAVQHYREFILSVPETKETAATRERANKFIKELEAEVAVYGQEQQPAVRLQAQPPKAPVVAEADRASQATRSYLRTGIFGGLTAVLAVGAVVAGVAAKNQFDARLADCAPGCNQEDIDGVKTRALVTNVLLGFTAAGAITTGIMLYVDSHTGETTVALARRF